MFIDGANAYYVYIGDTASPTYVRNTSLNIQKLNSTWSAFDTTAAGTVFTQSDVTHEAPFVLKVGSNYHMFTSNKDWWGPTRTDHRVGTSLAGWGAWSPLVTSPLNPDSFNTQFDFILPITGSAGTSYLYAGDRYSNFRGAVDGANARVAFSQGLGRNAWYSLTFSGTTPTVQGWNSTDVNITTGALAGNRVTNGAFDMYDATQSPAYWEEEKSAGWNPEASQSNTGGTVDGATNLPTNKLTISKDTAFQSFVSQDIAGLKSGASYTVQASIASSGGQTSAFMIVKQAGQPDVSISVGAAQHSFTTRSIPITVAAGSGGTVTIAFYVSSAANTWLAVDNVSLR